MLVAQLLTHKRAQLVSVLPWVSVGTAVRLMKREGVGAVLVLDEDGQLQGVLSERDVVHHLAECEGSVLDRAVSELIDRHGPMTAPDDTVQSVMELMTRTHTRHVPVVRYGVLVGIVSIGDVVKSRLEERAQENAILQDMARTQFFAH